MLDILHKIKNKFFPSRIVKFFRGLIGVYQRWEDRVFEILSPLPPFAKGGVIKAPFIKGGEVMPNIAGKASGGIWFRIVMYLIGGLIIGSVIFFTGDFVTATMIRLGNNSNQGQTPGTSIYAPLQTIDQGYLTRYYKMKFVNSNTVKDYSVSKVNGVFSGSGYSTTVGVIGDGLSLTGTSNEKFNSYKTLDETQSFSISVWANHSVAGTHLIFGNYQSPRGFQLGTYLGNATISSYGSTPSFENATVYAEPATGVWTLYTLTYDSSDQKFRVYVNKILRYTSAAITSIPDYGDREMYFGGRPVTTGFTWNGILDEARIYENKALSSDEISTIYDLTVDNVNANYPDIPTGLKLGSATTQSKAEVFQAKKGVNLIRYFKMDMSSATVVKDSSEYATDGVLGGSGVTVTSGGSPGVAFQFSSTATAYLNTTYDLIESSDFSVAVWAKMSAYATAQRVIFSSNRANTIEGGILLYVTTDNKLKLYAFPDTTADNPMTIEAPPTITDGNWHSIVIKYTKATTNLDLYVDGSLKGTMVTDIGEAGCGAFADIVTFGGLCSLVTTEAFRNGSLDEARIYNKALSQSEILDLYNLPTNLSTGSLSKGLIGRWELSKDSLQTSTRFGDSTPYNHPGISYRNGNIAEPDFEDGLNKTASSTAFVANDLDYIKVGNTGKTAKAVSFWVYIDPVDYPNFGTVAWTERTPAGDVYGFWYDVASNNDGSKLIAGANGRLWVSSNGGDTWGVDQRPGGLNQDLPWGSVDSDDDGSNLIAAYGSSAGKLYTSVNGVWTERTPAGAGTTKNWYSVASNSTGSTLIAGTYAGHIYVSTNYGVDWSDLNPGGGASPQWVAVASDSTGSYLAANAYAGGLYVSSDSGATWSLNRSFSANNNSMASDSTGAKLIGGWYNNKIYTSTNYGINWTARTPVGSWVKAASDDDGSALLSAANNSLLYSSLDGGINWTALSPPTTGNWQAVDLDSDGSNLIVGLYPGRLYTGTQPVINDELMEFGGGKTVTIAGNVVTTNLTSPTIYIDGQETSVFGSTGWHQVTINTDTGFAVNDFNIGKVGGSYFNGRLSDVRLYSSYTTLQDGLLAYWPMDEGTSNEIYDFSGNNNTGTLTNMADPATATSGWGAGYNSTGLNFSSAAVYDYVSVGTISIADNTPWSVSVWVKPTYLGYYVGIYGNAYGAGNWARLMLNGGDIWWVSDNNTPYLTWTSTGVTLNVWNHIVITCDGQTTATCYAFVNGKRLSAKTLVDSSQTIKVIGSLGSASMSFQGTIDDFRLYSRELSMDEIKQLYSL